MPSAWPEFYFSVIAMAPQFLGSSLSIRLARESPFDLLFHRLPPNPVYSLLTNAVYGVYAVRLEVCDAIHLV